MKIAIDTRWVFRELSGIGTYTRELVRALLPISGNHEILLLYSDSQAFENLASFVGLNEYPHATALNVRCGLFSAANQIFLPWLLRRQGVAVFHSPNYMIPFLAFPRDRAGRIRAVVTVHDVIPLRHPEFTPRSRKNRIPGLFRWLMREVARRADFLITVSECSRRDLLEELKLPPEKGHRVRVVPNGVGAEFFKVQRPSEVASTPRVLLYVGRFDPYKNVVGLIEIFARVRARGIDARLRIVGQEDARYPEPRERARRLGVEPFVEWRGYVHGSALASEYASADVFVLPSLYEGFGLTVLEAMAAGTPVVCSNAASLPEVTGDAALLCDPRDLDAFADAVVRVLQDFDLAQMLVRKGRERASQFLWRTTAEKTLDIYKEAAAV